MKFGTYDIDIKQLPKQKQQEFMFTNVLPFAYSQETKQEQ